MKKALLLLAIVFSVGCGLVQPTPQEIATAYYGPYPSNYQDIIKEHMKYKLFDPYSAVFEFPNQPARAWMVPMGNKVYGWAVVCLINGKNRMGGYVGFQEHQFLLRDGQVVLEGPWRGGLAVGIPDPPRPEMNAKTTPPTPEEDQAVVLARAREKAARGETLSGSEWMALYRADPTNPAVRVGQ